MCVSTSGARCLEVCVLVLLQTNLFLYVTAVPRPRTLSSASHAGLLRASLAQQLLDDEDIQEIGSGPGPGSGPGEKNRFQVNDPDTAGGGVRYDEYPVVVPKRAAVMVDRLFGILRNAVNGDANGGHGSSHGGTGGIKSLVADERMDLQRRGQQKGRVYWRCYFNAVTCFRRK